MLQNVFKDLYDQGVLIFLDTETYVTNNTDIPPNTFADRKQFLEMYGEQVEVGWIFTYTKSLDDVLVTIKDDTCSIVEFGFNADTEQKTLNLGRLLVNSLTKFKFMAHWDERALKDHVISTVITLEDLPEKFHYLLSDKILSD